MCLYVRFRVGRLSIDVQTNLLAKRAPFHEAHQRSRRQTTKIFCVVMNGSHPSHPHSLERFAERVFEEGQALPRPTFDLRCVWNLWERKQIGTHFFVDLWTRCFVLCGSRPQQILLPVVSTCFWIDVARPYLHCCFSTRRGQGIRGRFQNQRRLLIHKRRPVIERTNHETCTAVQYDQHDGPQEPCGLALLSNHQAIAFLLVQFATRTHSSWLVGGSDQTLVGGDGRLFQCLD